MEAIVYVRWSTQNQEDGDSLSRQIDAARRIAADRKWSIVEEHIERGKSAYHGRNRAEKGKLRDIEQRAERGELAGKVLMVEAMDRLSRQEPLESITLLTNLCKRGLTIYEFGSGQTYTAEKISENWANLVVALAKAGEAHESSRLKAKRVKSAWKRTQSAGRTKDGEADPRLCPAWMEVVDGEYTPIPERADVIRNIFDMALNGHGQRAIAAWANEQREKIGWPDGPWDIRAVGFICKDRRVLGEYTPATRTGANSREHGEPTKIYPEIVDAEVWHRTAQSIASRRSSGGPRAKCVNVLSHLARCTFVNEGQNVPCGEKMNMRPQKRGPTQLTCSSYNRGRGCRSNASYRYTETLEGIFKHVLPLALRLNAPLENSAAGKIAIARAELAQQEQRLAERADKLFNGNDDPDEFLLAAYERAKASYRENKAALMVMEAADERNSSLQTPAELANEAMTLRSSLDDPEARMRLQVILDNIIDGIYFDVETRGSTVVMLGGYIALKLDKMGNYIEHVDALNQLQEKTHYLTDGGTLTVDPRPEGLLHTNPLTAAKLERAIDGMTAGDLRRR